MPMTKSTAKTAGFSLLDNQINTTLRSTASPESHWSNVHPVTTKR